MIYYDNIDVAINGSGIMAESASLQIEGGISPIYRLGRRGIAGQFPKESIKNNISLSYIPELDNEPTYDALYNIKNNLSNLTWTGVTIEIGGITGYNCFLQNYSIKASPNELIKSNASYISYEPISGDLQQKGTGILYNLTNNIAHSWTTFILSTGNYLNIPTYDFEYNFKAQWEPIYILGNKYPVQILLNNIDEQLSFTRDRFLNIPFSGEPLTNNYFNYASGDFNIMLLNLSIASGGATGNYGALYFSIDNAIIKNTQINAAVNNIVKVVTTANRHY